MSENHPMRPARIEALTGLRFLAAMMVFCFHFDRSLKTQFFFGPMGGIAVSFFFVLSGFILTYVYRDRLKWGALKRFYFTRWARIWPLHAVCLSATIWLFPYQKVVEYPEIRLACNWFLLQSWIPDLDYVLSYNGVAWSISTEAFFYLLFPLFLLGGLKNFWWKYLLTIGLTAVALVGLTKIAAMPELAARFNPHHISHFNPFMRLFEFVSGMAVAYLFMSMRVGSVRLLQIARWPVFLQTVLEIAVLLLAALSFYLLQWLGYYGWVNRGLGLGGEVAYWLVYCGGMPFHALCIYVFAQSNGWLGRCLSTKLMIFLGEISFALYMVHRTVILMTISKYWNGSDLPYWVIIGGCFFMSIGVSALLFLVVEMPCKNTLLKYFDGKFIEGFKGFFSQILNVFKRKSAYVVIALIVFPLITLDWFRNNRPNLVPLEQVVAASTVDPVRFGAVVELTACHFEPRRMGTQVCLVWSSDGTVWVRHEYLLTGTKYKTKGTLKLENGQTIQRFFVHDNHWLRGTDIEMRLWQKDDPLLPNAASSGGNATAEASTYKLALGDQGDGGETQ